MKLRTIFLVAMLASLLGVRAQELTVKSMAAAPTDLSASTYERKDLTGKPCALVKVQLATTGALFEGNVIGKSEYKTGEYWVYMSEGSYMLSVKHPSFVPLSVNFCDYGISGVKEKATYILTLLMTQVMSRAEGFPLKVSSSFDSGFERGNFPEGVMGFLSTLPQWRLGSGSGSLNVFRNLFENQYDQLYTITHEGLINNVSIGDVLTILPEDESYQPLYITITDSILKTNEVKCILTKRRSSLHGYVIDGYTHKPIQNSKISLYVGNYADYGGNSTGLFNDFGYRRFFEIGESVADYLTGDNGYFGWKNCVIDYTYYIKAKTPKGYAKIGFNEGVDIKPKDNINDSLIIMLWPSMMKGVVTYGETAIPDVEIECETLYGKKIITTGQDGCFEINGLTSEFIRFKHDNVRVMDIKFDDYDVDTNKFNSEHSVTIGMKKGNQKTPFKGEYKWGKIKEIK